MHAWLQILPLLIAGIVQIIPIIGLGGQKTLSFLYGVTIKDPSTLLMMQHRALLLALVGLVLLLAIPFSNFRMIAIGIGLLSKLGYLILVWQAGEIEAPLKRVAMIDLATTTLLLVAAVSLLWEHLGTKSPPTP